MANSIIDSIKSPLFRRMLLDPYPADSNTTPRPFFALPIKLPRYSLIVAVGKISEFEMSMIALL